MRKPLMMKNILTPRSPSKIQVNALSSDCGKPSAYLQCAPNTDTMLTARHPSKDGNRELLLEVGDCRKVRRGRRWFH